MNVEEGELRPQLLDRFGLGVEVRAPRDPAERAEIVRRRLAFQADPAAFAAQWGPREAALRERIAAARERLPAVRLPERELLRITGACAALGIDGARGDIVTARAAQALAALEGDDEVTEAHVRRAAPLALSHRRRRDPLGDDGGQESDLDRALDGDDDGRRPREAAAPTGNGHEPAANPQPPSPGSDPPEPSPQPSQGSDPSEAPSQAPDARRPTPDAPARERLDAPLAASLPLEALALAGAGAGPTGRRARTKARPAAPSTAAPRPPAPRTSRSWPRCARACSAPTPGICASTSAPAARARCCASSSTRAARWAPGGASRGSRARSSRYCATPTRAATRSRPSPSATRPPP